MSGFDPAGLIGGLGTRLREGAEDLAEAAASTLDGSLRLGVTGLSGAGKTVFITALVSSLLARGRMRALSAEAEGRILAVLLRPQPDPGVARFAHEAHVGALKATPALWPVSTRSVSQLRLAIRYRPTGLLSGWTGPATLTLDIVDYPGEWLPDLPLLDCNYATWAASALKAAETPARAGHAGGWRRALAAADPAAEHTEPAAEALATAWADHLQACRVAGLAALTPGRFLMPGDLAGSPALTFAPLPRPEDPNRESLYAEMERRFEAYKRVVIKPFFRDHFARLDRQVVLVDALGALAAGPRALADLTGGLAGALEAFRHGAGGWLDRLTGRRRIDRVLIAASKADHLHHEGHGALSALVEAMLSEAVARARFAGADLQTMAVAAVRATVEQEMERAGVRVPLVRGRRLDTGAEAAIDPGELPADPRALVAEALAGSGNGPGHAPEHWPEAAFAALCFAPPAWGARAEDGPPHIRMDRALEFLLGDRLL
ncbi:MAG: YcjX family protein [Pseudomonadota bacterium]